MFIYLYNMVLAQMSEVMQVHVEFQRALGEVLKPCDDQLAAQVATQWRMVDHNDEKLSEWSQM